MTDLGHYDYEDFDKLVKDVADLQRRVKGLEWLAKGDGNELADVAKLQKLLEEAAHIFQLLTTGGMNQALYYSILDWQNKYRTERDAKEEREEGR